MNNIKEDKRYLNIIKTENEEMELSIGGTFIERVKLILELLLTGKIVFKDWSWFGNDEN